MNRSLIGKRWEFTTSNGRVHRGTVTHAVADCHFLVVVQLDDGSGGWLDGFENGAYVSCLVGGTDYVVHES